ncbi:MAG: FAD:protein FMN transferase [Corallococcus sp.]|nr:FAD:protein FMN transferase [Corallococcus sp.]
MQILRNKTKLKIFLVSAVLAVTLFFVALSCVAQPFAFAESDGSYLIADAEGGTESSSHICAHKCPVCGGCVSSCQIGECKAKCGHFFNLNSNSHEHSGFVFRNTYFGASNISLQCDVYKKSAYITDFDVLKIGGDIDAYVKRIDSLVNPQSAEIPSEENRSDIYRFNNAQSGAKVAVSEETAEMYRIAKKMYEMTDGAYNPASYRLVDLWGFSARTYCRDGNLPYDRKWKGNSLPLPEDKYVREFKKLSDFASVVLVNEGGQNYLVKNCPDVTVDGVRYSQWLDFGGVAKGYVADGVGQLLKQSGFEHYFINCGSSSMVYTSYEDGSPIGVGFQNPYTLYNTYLQAETADAGISTSGQYQRQYYVDGKRYCHIIDCKTGRPVESPIQSITIIGGKASEADCLTTALTILGRDNLVEFMNGKYCHDNKLTVFAAVDSERGNQIISNKNSDAFTFVNDEFAFATQVVPTTNPNLLQQEITTIVEYNPKAMSKAQIQKTVVICVVSVFAAAIAVYLIVKVVRSKKIAQSERIRQVKSDKFFRKTDLFVYGLVAVLIVVLFGVFVFGAGDGDAADRVQIVTFGGQQLFTYSASDDRYAVYEVNSFAVDVKQEGNVVTVTVKTSGGGFNEIEIKREGNKLTANMKDSDCGLHKECVNYFPAITAKDGVIVCQPHGIKVLASEDGNSYILV